MIDLWNSHLWNITYRTGTRRYNGGIFKLPYLHLFVFILLVGMLSACSHPSDKTVETKLSQAEAIMYAAPDSALQLLENLRPPKEKEQRATWALLLAQARYKTEVRQSDSLVNTASV